MTLTLTWEAVLGTLAVMGAFGGIAAWYVRVVVRQEITAAVDRINGTYVRAGLCHAIHGQQETRLATIESRLSMIEEKAL